MSRRRPSSPLDRFADNLLSFPVRHHGRIVQLALRSIMLARLTVTFPLAALLIATEYGPAEARARAIGLTEACAPLSQVADALGLPLCLRRIPAHACPDDLPYAHWTPHANVVLGDRIPFDDKDHARWLRCLFTAHAAGDEAFALWFTARVAVGAREIDSGPMAALALYAWMSCHHPLPLAHTRVRPWTADAMFHTTVLRARCWAHEIGLIADLGVNGLSDPWCGRTVSGGLTFQPLITPDDLLEEAQAMNNCVDGYGRRLADGDCRLFGIRRGDCRIATVEVVYDPERGYMPVEMRGPRNATCTLDVALAVWDWIEVFQSIDQPVRPVREPEAREAAVEALLASYADAHPHRPARPLAVVVRDISKITASS